jgi:uncharacterized protein (TIGR00369 family)
MNSINNLFPGRQDHLAKALRGEKDLSPSTRMMGFKLLDCDTDTGRTTVEFAPPDDCLNARGVIQGGFVSVMLDDVMGPTMGIMLEEDQFCPTIELKTNFLNPCPAGKLIGKGQVRQRGKSIGFVEAQLEDPDGNIIATASGTLRIMSMKTPKG